MITSNVPICKKMVEECDNNILKKAEKLCDAAAALHAAKLDEDVSRLANEAHQLLQGCHDDAEFCDKGNFMYS